MAARHVDVDVQSKVLVLTVVGCGCSVPRDLRPWSPTSRPSGAGLGNTIGTTSYSSAGFAPFSRNYVLGLPSPPGSDDSCASDTGSDDSVSASSDSDDSDEEDAPIGGRVDDGGTAVSPNAVPIVSQPPPVEAQHGGSDADSVAGSEGAVSVVTALSVSPTKRAPGLQSPPAQPPAGSPANAGATPPCIPAKAAAFLATPASVVTDISAVDDQPAA